MTDLPRPKKHMTSHLSAIGVLPLVALAGVDIQVRFESGDGIQANKTEVLYKGISVGKVTDLHVCKDIKGVVATIEIKKEAQEYLSKDTRFW
ncbi:MlaD family protein, partial [Pseudomonas aeruginosa]